MLFNKLIHHILKENNSNMHIPALDGGREFYYVTITTRLYVIHLRRAIQSLEYVWEKNDENIVSDYQQAINVLTDQCTRLAWMSYKTDEKTQECVDDVITQLKAIKDLPGKWRVFDNQGDPVDSLTDTFNIGLEFDAQTFIKTRYGSAIQNTPELADGLDLF